MEKKTTQKDGLYGIKVCPALTTFTTTRAVPGAYNIKNAINTGVSIATPTANAHHHHQNYLENLRQSQQHQRSTAVSALNTKGNSNSQNNNNDISAAISKITPCIQTPMEQLQAVHAKVTSIRTKNEEAIHDLRTRIPEIENIFDVHCRIGNGTFSTVLLATLKKERDIQENSRRKFAIKHHIPTSHPERIMKELKCMAKIGGTDNVVGINCCLRFNESVAFIMPYLAHDRFHDFFQKMDVSEVQFYIKNLLIALRHVHRFNVIHRDVKPSNFLYNRRKRQFLLVDFGLAQEVPIHQHAEIKTSSSVCAQNKNNVLTKQHLEPIGNDSKNGLKRSRDGESISPCNETEKAKRMRVNGGDGISAAIAAEAVGTSFKMPLKQINEIQQNSNGTSDTTPPISRQVKTAALGITLSQRLQNKSMQQRGDAALMRATGGACIGQQHTPIAQTGSTNTNATTSAAVSQNNDNTPTPKYNTNRNIIASQNAKCNCYGNPQVCNMCLVKKEIHASRAGTPGYRPPEVLLKYPDQTTAVDIWAAGVIFLSILSSVYPFFKAPNDYVALAEMVTIFGDKTIRKTAFVLDRLVTLSQKSKPLDLRKLCVRFRNRTKFSSPELLKKYQKADGTCEVCKNCDQYYFNCLCTDSTYKTEPFEGDDSFPQSAYDLLNKLLEVNPHKRITAEEALQHPFLMETYDGNHLHTMLKRERH